MNKKWNKIFSGRKVFFVLNTKMKEHNKNSVVVRKLERNSKINKNDFTAHMILLVKTHTMDDVSTWLL